MEKKESSKKPAERTDNTEGYPLYPPKDDIYNRYKEEQNVDPEDPSHLKEPLPDPKEDVNAEEELSNPELLNDDLDVPGAELDDEQEKIGSEDEENNYYSIGGDNHHDLEED